MVIYGHGVLWDPSKGKAVARFIDGELSTVDPRIIELAVLAGFHAVGDVEDEPEEAPVEETVETPVETPVDEKAELIAQAEELGIDVDRRWGAERLRQAISEAE